MMRFFVFLIFLVPISTTGVDLTKKCGHYYESYKRLENCDVQGPVDKFNCEREILYNDFVTITEECRKYLKKTLETIEKLSTGKRTTTCKWKLC
ncbi:unnamed protein product [Caenorhabditis angaria]|uniref:DUF19 domain-containing protein n=1 Tax=Caenorhabditis angaria TaxID=860376 RepID=A0A9P1N3U4_9PELO|nr:unnamed protein product [Caenorhabditis angaria]